MQAKLKPCLPPFSGSEVGPAAGWSPFLVNFFPAEWTSSSKCWGLRAVWPLFFCRFQTAGHYRRQRWSKPTKAVARCAPPPPRINRGNAVQHTSWKSPHDDTRPQLFASTMQVVQFLSEAMKQRITYVHRYSRLSARSTPFHAYPIFNTQIPQTLENPPPVCIPSHAHYFMVRTSSSRAAVRERHDLRASAVRKEHRHLRTAPTIAERAQAHQPPP